MSSAIVDCKDSGSTNHPDAHFINFLACVQNSDENIPSGMTVKMNDNTRPKNIRTTVD